MSAAASPPAPVLPTLALPGQPLRVQSPPYIAGPGTHLTGTSITSTLCGIPTFNPTTKELSVLSPATYLSASTITSPATLLPSISSTVLARVTRINPRTATVSILIVDGVPSVDTFQGVIRQQDVRATEKDKVKIYESFRPGDVVRAVVISLGDQRDYYLSTAGNSLGVIMAQSEDGETLMPKSWKEMVSATGVVEARKVAKPV